MKENLYYLFVSGLLLGSGPCLSLCAPLLISYTVALKPTLKKSIISYLIFSLFKLISYVILGILCALGVTLLKSPGFREYLDTIYLILGCFIIIIGLATIFYKREKNTKICSWLHKGNIRNVGILGLLVGFSPCLPLLGILNYIVIISNSYWEAIIFTSLFGLGITLSPLLILVMLSGKIAEVLSQSKKLKTAIRIVGGIILLFLGGKIIHQKLLQ